MTGIAVHLYEPDFMCNNYIAPNGREYSGNCSHMQQFDDAHCLHCGNAKSASMHQPVVI